MGPLFEVNNKHVAACGDPPSIDANTPNRYHSYFENAQGKKNILIYDYSANAGTLYHGDLGWGRPRPVKDGKCPNVILDDAEALWLQACWLATSGRFPRRK